MSMLPPGLSTMRGRESWWCLPRSHYLSLGQESNSIAGANTNSKACPGPGTCTRSRLDRPAEEMQIPLVSAGLAAGAQPLIAPPRHPDLKPR